MPIALVAPLAEAVSPKFSGGTERVISWLAEKLVREGHQVALFASRDSETTANRRHLHLPAGVAAVRACVSSSVCSRSHMAPSGIIITRYKRQPF